MNKDSLVTLHEILQKAVRNDRVLLQIELNQLTLGYINESAKWTNLDDTFKYYKHISIDDKNLQSSLEAFRDYIEEEERCRQ